MTIKIVRADYRDPQHARDLVYLLNQYALDPMGGGLALPREVQATLAGALAELPHAVSLLAYVDDEPAGVANCFEGFSTFACRKLLNIHDIAVLAKFRGLGVSREMLQELEVLAGERSCVKLTLEVLEGNHTAKAAYENFGFEPYALDPDTGVAQFWEKTL